MNPIKAIISAFRNYGNLDGRGWSQMVADGRASQFEYWWFFLFFVVFLVPPSWPAWSGTLHCWRFGSHTWSRWLRHYGR